MTCARMLSAVAIVLFSALPAFAQPILNPSTLEFTASADHNAVELGAPKLTSYDVEFWQAGGTAPVQHKDIGKPTPNASNVISVNLTLIARPILLAGTYTIKVAALGPGGASKAPDSDPFDLRALPPAAPASKPVIK